MGVGERKGGVQDSTFLAEAQRLRYQLHPEDGIAQWRGEIRKYQIGCFNQGTKLQWRCYIMSDKLAENQVHRSWSFHADLRLEKKWHRTARVVDFLERLSSFENLEAPPTR